MAEKIQIAHIEDEKATRLLINAFLRLSDLEVVAEAGNLPAALELIQQLSELNIKLVIIDGNLQSGDGSGNDGRLIATAVANQHPQILRVGYSGSHLDYTHQSVLKTQGPKVLVQTITSLLATKD